MAFVFKPTNNGYLNGRNATQTVLEQAEMISRDETEAIVSSADMTQDSLLGQFNAGVLTSDKETIRKLIGFYTDVWNKSGTL